MIDFIKIYTDKKENLEHRIKNNLEDTVCALNFYTGEVQYPCRQYAQNMEVRVTKNRGLIRNSIHKFFNMEFFNESNNHSDFNLSELELALQSLSQKFGKEIMDYKVTNLEFGLNIETSLPAQKILENNFIMYNFDNFSQLDTFKNRGYYKQYNRTEYYLKFMIRVSNINCLRICLGLRSKSLKGDCCKKWG